MKTTTILKTLALALLMPTMLLTAACSNSDDIVNTEKPANTKGYALPVTVNVTRQGGDATRAIYDESTKKLSFSTGDKLFIEGYQSFAGMLTMVSDGKFTGEILTEIPYTGTVEDLLTSDEIEINAYLLPAGYENYGFLNIVDKDTYHAYLYYDNSKVFALTKKEAVEQLSFEKHWDYDTSLKGFELMPATAILNFTISGLAANTAVSVSFKRTEYDEDVTPVNITTDASGVATFAAAMRDQDNFDDYSLTVDGTAIALPENKEVEAGHIYNISRSVASGPTLLSAATAEDCGKVVCADGHLHDAKTAVPSGCTAVGILGKVTETGHGLILALKNATSQTWNTINGWASASYAGTTLKVLPDEDARGTNLTSYTTLGETTVSNWAVAQKSDYVAIFTNLGSTRNSGGMTYDNNVNAYITTGVGGTAMSGSYWSATQDDDYDAWYFQAGSWYDDYNTSTYYVRPVLGF